MIRRLLFAVAVLAMTAPLAFAADTPAPAASKPAASAPAVSTPAASAQTTDASGETLDGVLAKHYAALGGLDKLKALQSMRVTGKMMMGQGMEAPFTIEKARPNRMRLEFQFQGMTGIQAFDGKTGWSVMPFMGKKDPEPMTADAMKEVEEEADFDGPLMDWQSKGHKLELLGKEDVEGTSAYKIKATLKNGNVTNYFIDAETFLILKQEGKRNFRGTEVEGETSMGDYKQVDGLTVPFAIESGIKGSEQKQKMVWEKVEFNTKPEDSRFVMPVVAKSDSTKADAKTAAAKPAAKTPAKAKATDSKTAAKKTDK